MSELIFLTQWWLIKYIAQGQKQKLSTINNIYLQK